jgi:molybdopterin/thiamine biosynthesis adenylyltransferase
MTELPDNERFARHLGLSGDVFRRPRITIELPSGQEQRPESVCAFMLAANLAARLFDDLHLVVPDVPLGPNPWGLSSISGLREPLAGISDGSVNWGPPDDADIVLGIGAMPRACGKQSTFVTFNGWAVGLETAVEAGEPGIFGGLLAACYGVAQVFLLAAASVGGNRQPMQSFVFSLLDYTCSSACAPTPTSLALIDTHLVGVGAVGCALVYCLGHFAGSRGLLCLIDNDFVDTSNLRRYILMRRGDIGRAKTEVAANLLRATGLTALSEPVDFAAYAKAHGSKIDLLITPVDSEAGRRELAAWLPRTVLNAATGASTVTVSRHGFADGKACLRCLYLPRENEMTTEKRLAQDMGLSEAEVSAHLLGNKTINEDLVARVEAARGVRPGTFRGWAGKNIQSFYQRAVCGEAPVTTAAGTILSPLSFISAAAGVLLAAEYVKSQTRALSCYALDNYFRLDTLSAPNPAFRRRKPQDATGRCICHDPDYIEAYHEKYGIGGAERVRVANA